MKISYFCFDGFAFRVNELGDWKNAGKLELNRIYLMDRLAGLKSLPNQCIRCSITSPPYWNQRDYGVEGQYGLKASPELYVSKLAEVFRELKRVLKPDGTFWLNLGDAYWGSGKAGRNPVYQEKHREFVKPPKDKTRFGRAT